VPDGDTSAPRLSQNNSNLYNTFGNLSLSDIVEFAQRHITLMAYTTGAAITVALMYLLYATPLFTAYGELLIDAKVPHLANEQWTETGIVLDSAQVESQIAVLMSEHIARAVASRLELAKDPEFNKGGVPPAEPGDEAAKAAADKMLRDIAVQLQSHLGIRRVGLSYVLEISFTARDPLKAANVANAIMGSYIDDQIAMRAQAARQGSEWLEKRINTLRIQMNAASLKVQEFKARRDYSIVGRPDSGDGAKEENGKDNPNALTETLDELESTAMTYRKMFESSLQAYTEAEQRQSYPVSNARIISTATPPLRRSSPKRLQTLAVATAAGLLLGLGLALLQEGLQHARATRSKRDDSEMLS
jgi:uncharacterized protein involved in exopolysaccharide biosynthesis